MNDAWSEIRTLQLIHALASTIGMDRARKVVAEAGETLGMAGEVLSNQQACALLDVLSRDDGIVGVTARFVKLRIESGRSLPAGPPPPDSVPPPSDRVSLVDVSLDAGSGVARVFSRRSIAALLSGTLGEQVAESSVFEAADALGLPLGAMTQDQAMLLLDALAERAGVVGVTARFAKTRMLVRQTG